MRGGIADSNGFQAQAQCRKRHDSNSQFLYRSESLSVLWNQFLTATTSNGYMDSAHLVRGELMSQHTRPEGI
jgi:hypothetical protein